MRDSEFKVNIRFTLFDALILVVSAWLTYIIFEWIF